MNLPATFLMLITAATNPAEKLPPNAHEFVPHQSIVISQWSDFAIDSTGEVRLPESSAWSFDSSLLLVEGRKKYPHSDYVVIDVSKGKVEKVHRSLREAMWANLEGDLVFMTEGSEEREIDVSVWQRSSDKITPHVTTLSCPYDDVFPVSASTSFVHQSQCCTACPPSWRLISFKPVVREIEERSARRPFLDLADIKGDYQREYEGWSELDANRYSPDPVNPFRLAYRSYLIANATNYSALASNPEFVKRCIDYPVVSPDGTKIACLDKRNRHVYVGFLAAKPVDINNATERMMLSESSASLNRKALDLFRSKQFEQASFLWRMALLTDPFNAEVLNNLGFALTKWEKPEKHAYREPLLYILCALQVDPSRAVAWLNAAQILEAGESPKERAGAYQAYTEFARLDPKNRLVPSAVEKAEGIRASFEEGEVISVTQLEVLGPNWKLEETQNGFLKLRNGKRIIEKTQILTRDWEPNCQGAGAVEEIEAPVFGEPGLFVSQCTNAHGSGVERKLSLYRVEAQGLKKVWGATTQGYSEGHTIVHTPSWSTIYFIGCVDADFDCVVETSVNDALSQKYFETYGLKRAIEWSQVKGKYVDLANPKPPH